jgi:hypothetical protein
MTNERSARRQSNLRHERAANARERAAARARAQARPRALDAMEGGADAAA